MRKLTWEPPQLIVLSRGNPEEAVLGNCKYKGVGFFQNDGPGYTDSGCYTQVAGVGCGNCDTPAGT